MAGVRGHGVKWGEAGGVGGHAASLSIWTLSKHHGKLEQGILSREGLRFCWLWEDGAGDQLLEHRPVDGLWRGQEQLAS